MSWRNFKHPRARCVATEAHLFKRTLRPLYMSKSAAVSAPSGPKKTIWKGGAPKNPCVPPPLKTHPVHKSGTQSGAPRAPSSFRLMVIDCEEPGEPCVFIFEVGADAPSFLLRKLAAQQAWEHIHFQDGPEGTNDLIDPESGSADSKFDALEEYIRGKCVRENQCSGASSFDGFISIACV